jgi:hypothetical protein
MAKQSPSDFGKNFKLFLADGNGEFVPIGPIAMPRRIVCSPQPGTHGIEYVPDWWGITHFG